MKYRTIEEAKNIKIPDYPESIYREYNFLASYILASNDSAIEKMSKIYAFTDKCISLIAHHFVCKLGCSHCCHINVHITTLEAYYIGQKHHVEINHDRPFSFNYGQDRTPCTFLSKEGKCTIYSDRPFVCRVFHVLDDPKYCEKQTPNHVTYSITEHKLFIELNEMIKHLNNEKPTKDIRDFFPK